MANPEAFRQFNLRGVHVTENELGHGSYAVVLELKYQGLKCAGKKLYRVLYESGISYAARRYLEECQLLSQIRHPHIVQFIGVFFEEGSQFPILVMEFLPTNLSSCLDQYGILSNEMSYSILHDVSLGLSYLHGQISPIVHRDLSANNVLLSKDMTAKISDLGVARILNLTPLQVSRMTETPGTPAYMPPEVMVANPHYDTSVDVFSFGVMMIHTFTAEWPLPSVGPSRVDPTNPDRVIAVTEAERREEFLRKIAQDHPLMDLIMMCLSNHPQRRPRAEEIVCRMGDMVLQYPPSFENRVEMLQRISALNTEKRELEQEIVRKNATIQEKAGENEQLNEEKRQQMEVNESTLERFKLANSVEANQKAAENEYLKGQLEVHESLTKNLRAQTRDLSNDVEQQRASITALTTQVEALTAQVEYEKVSKTLGEATVQSLNAQLEQTRDYLSRKPQVHLSCSECTEAPESMSGGKAVTVNSKVYLGGGDCDPSIDVNECFIYCYNPSDNVWSTLPNLPISHFGMGKVNNELVTVGGFKYGARTNEVYVLVEGRNWKQTIPPMPTARSRPAIVSLPTHLVAAGGKADTYYGCSDAVEIYNINASQWSKTDQLPYLCFDPKGTVFNNTVYFLGGMDVCSQRLNNVVAAEIDQLISNAVPVCGQEDLHPNTSGQASAWTEIAVTPRYDPSTTIVIPNIVLAIGGLKKPGAAMRWSKDYEPTQRVYAYSSSMNSWVYIGDLPSPRTWTATVSLSPTEFLVIGGRDESGNRLKTVTKVTLDVIPNKVSL